MTTQQPEPSPGWYPDRITAGMNRWWDGTQWTSHTQPATPAVGADYLHYFSASFVPSST